ncbi:cupin domain-containing protein [Coprothermobacter platensis]|uniref:cupin domain-containing protein n=1 Tax=Coprothermobacter platensis TaxID=108819 RepID=UPI000366ED89|nr:cupin domain-containing protein [Coprothermobacter platensis]
MADYYKVNYKDVPTEDVSGTEGGVSIRWLLHKDIGVPHFEMRLFEFPVGAKMFPHRHSWEHEIFTLEGEGRITVGDEPVDVKAGDAMFIEPQALHGYENTGSSVWKFICVIPKRD